MPNTPQRTRNAIEILTQPQLKSMSSYFLVVPVEVLLLVPHTCVFIISIKLAQQPSRNRTFFLLYSLQNLAELIAYLTVPFEKNVVGIIRKRKF